MSKRTKLSDEFIEALAESWKVHGDTVLNELAKTDGKALARICADLVPKQIEAKIETHNFDGLSVTELRELVIEGMAGAIEKQVQDDLPKFERLVKAARKAQKRGKIPPNGYASMSSRDRWLVDHGRKAKELVAADKD